MIRSILNKTLYELLEGWKLNPAHLHYVHNNRKDALGKFEAKSDKEIFLGYPSHSKACKVYNKGTKYIKQSAHIIFDKASSMVKKVF